jgi:hypothetical protein
MPPSSPQARRHPSGDKPPSLSSPAEPPTGYNIPMPDHHRDPVPRSTETIVELVAGRRPSFRRCPERWVARIASPALFHVKRPPQKGRDLRLSQPRAGPPTTWSVGAASIKSHGDLERMASGCPGADLGRVPLLARHLDTGGLSSEPPPFLPGQIGGARSARATPLPTWARPVSPSGPAATASTESHLVPDPGRHRNAAGGPATPTRRWPRVLQPVPPGSMIDLPHAPPAHSSRERASSR